MKKILFAVLSIIMLSVVSCKKPEPQPELPKPEITLSQGTVTEDQVEFFLSATDADEVAYCFVNTTEDVVNFTAEAIFAEGEVFTASTEPVSFVMTDLQPENEYTVFAAASKEGQYFSEAKKLVVETAPKPRLIEFVSSAKTEFSYKVNSEPGQVYYHTYLEGWFFEYNYEMNKYLEGDAFDVKTFIWNLLAEYGEYADAPQTVEWYAGKENASRGDFAYLVPGTKYYVLAARFDEETAEGWVENPEIIEVMLDAPGKSDKTVACSIEGLSPYSVNIRMEMDAQDVCFYMYDFFEKSQYKSYVAENGIEGMMAYVSEYSLGKGQAKVNTYTDTWTVAPGKSYMLCLYGVDHNGDEFYTELEVNVPMPDAKIHLGMEPYERDLEGYNTYNTLKVSATYADFVNLDYESSAFYLAGGPVEKAVFDALMESVGLSGTLEDLEAQGEMLYALGQANMGLNPVSVDEEILATLKDRGFFTKVYTGLNPDTEYIYMVMAHYDGKIMCRLATAKTDAAPVDVTESEAYKAFLGNWDVTGQNTLTWSNSDMKTYHLTIDRLTSNRSYKIYGWSDGQLGQEFPFEAGFDEASGKMTISTPQTLGEVEIEGKVYEVRFVGKARNKYAPDTYMVLYDYEGLAYKVTMDEPYLHFLSEFFQYAGEYVDFKSLSYVFYDKETKEYFQAEPYDLTTGFKVTRAK